MSSKYERIRGGNGDFNSAQTSFRSLFWTFHSVLVIVDYSLLEKGALMRS